MDKIFKIGLLVLGFSYLAYLFCPIANQIGRYNFHQIDKTMYVMDTANADLYIYYKKENVWVRANPKTGRMDVEKLKIRTKNKEDWEIFKNSKEKQ
jgi:hypothetical protein